MRKKKISQKASRILIIALAAVLLGGTALALRIYEHKAAPTSEQSIEKQTAKIQAAQNAPAVRRQICKPVSHASNPCSPENLLPYFPDQASAEQASAICNLESRGNPNTQSYVDFCRDGSVFSFGLFQINVIAQEHLIPECAGVFKTTMDPAIGDVACVKKNNGVCVISDCRVIDQEKYAACRAAVTGIEKNITLAASIWKDRGSWKDWGAYAFCKAKF
jgi:hypothetical protein